MNFKEFSNGRGIKNLFVPEFYLGPECNNKCKFCSLLENEFPVKKTSDVKKELKVLGKFTKDVKFTGGEITLKPDIKEIISYAKGIGFENIYIGSNGRIFKEEGYVDNMVKSGVNGFSIIIHGYNQDSHEKLTGIKGSFNETLEGIKNLLKYKVRSLTVDVVVTKSNYEHIPEIIKFLWEFKIDSVNIKFAVACGSLLIKRGDIPMISDVMPYTKTALNNFSGKNITVSYIPPCFLKGFEKYLKFVNIPSKAVIENPNFTITVESEIEKKMIKGKVCKKCKFFDVCNGLWKEYADLYGFDELKPVKGKKIKSLGYLKKEFG
ncbi:MAG: radical SAM protein [Candidatus Aenigmarchaeota archaeon]|nr:radical SAM protein [Candidatus Aenigmarchaeota archaeon]